MCIYVCFFLNIFEIHDITSNVLFPCVVLYHVTISQFCLFSIFDRHLGCFWFGVF